MWACVRACVRVVGTGLELAPKGISCLKPLGSPGHRFHLSQTPRHPQPSILSLGLTLRTLCPGILLARPQAGPVPGRRWV